MPQYTQLSAPLHGRLLWLSRMRVLIFFFWFDFFLLYKGGLQIFALPQTIWQAERSTYHKAAVNQMNNIQQDLGEDDDRKGVGSYSSKSANKATAI